MSLDLSTLKETVLTTMEDMVMKALISIILCLGLSLLFTNANLLARQAEHQIVPLSEADYECFQRLSCIAESEELREKGWFVTFDETILEDIPQERTARLKGDNIAVSAKYDREGKLIRAIYERKDAALPRVLLAHIAGEDFAGWRMTGNEITIRDFDQSTALYTIVFSNGSEQKKVSFSHADVAAMAGQKEQMSNKYPRRLNNR